MTDELKNVPEIVRKQAEEAVKLFNAATGQPPVEEKPVEAEPAPETPAKEPEKAAEEAPAEEKKPVPTTLKDVATEEMTKEQRYKIMEGIQKAAGRDLSRAQAEARALREELAALNARIATATSVQPTNAPAKAADAGGTSNELREQVAEAFGAENVDKFFRLMRQEGFVAKPDLDEIRGEVGSVARNVAQSAQDRFQNTMEDLAPGWTKINEDPKFIEYMNEEEGRSGMSRLDFAKLHLGRLDAPRLAQYFVDFGASNSGTPAPAAAKLDKKKFAAPPSTPATGKEPEEKDVAQPVKASDMERFSREVIIEKYKGNIAAMNEKDAKMWNMYLTAQRENRIFEDKRK